MKKTLLVAALAVFGFANAQKGTVLVQGNIGFSSTTTTDLVSETKNNEFTVAPKIGYQFNDHWTAGVAFGVTAAKQTVENNQPFPNASENKTTALTVGGFVRYTKKLNETFSVYADLDAGYVHAKNTISTYDGFTGITNNGSNKANGFYAGITPNVFVNVYKNFGLNFGFGGLSFVSAKDDSPADRKTNAFEVTFGEVFNVGISKNF